MANTAFNHDPALTVAASNTTAGAAVKWVASKNLGESLIILDSGGNGRIGLAGDLDLITLTANTVTVAGTVAATALTGDGSALTGISAGATLSGSTNNTVVTVTGSNAMIGEANLTYDGAELNVGGTSAKLVLDQGSGDGYIFELRSTDVAHGISGYNTNTYGQFMKKHPTSGMLQIWGFSDADANQAIGVSITGVSGIAANTAKTTAAIGIVEILGGIKSGSGIANPGSNGNILVIRDAASGSAKMIVDQEGDVRVNEGSGMPSVTKGAAKAWVAYDYGGGTPTILGSASYNVSSLGDDGTGHVQINFTTNMSQANHYVCVVTAGATAPRTAFSTLTASSADFKVWNSSETAADLDGSVAIFGVSN
jgi:hypothetical protein